EYDFYTFTKTSNGTVTLTSYISPAFNGNGNTRRVRLRFKSIRGSSDDLLFAHHLVSYIIKYQTSHAAAPGAHTLKIWMLEPAVVPQRFVIGRRTLVLPSLFGFEAAEQEWDFRSDDVLVYELIQDITIILISMAPPSLDYIKSMTGTALCGFL
ncbi:hypothetical protein FRC06_010718, partial [Ceratobasidium sp. 370]